TANHLRRPAPSPLPSSTLHKKRAHPRCYKTRPETSAATAPRLASLPSHAIAQELRGKTCECARADREKARSSPQTPLPKSQSSRSRLPFRQFPPPPPPPPDPPPPRPQVFLPASPWRPLPPSTQHSQFPEIQKPSAAPLPQSQKPLASTMTSASAPHQTAVCPKHPLRPSRKLLSACIARNLSAKALCERAAKSLARVRAP